MSPSTRGSTSRTSALAKLSVMSPPVANPCSAAAGAVPTSTPVPGTICARSAGATGVGLATSGALADALPTEVDAALAAAAVAEGCGCGVGPAFCDIVQAELAKANASTRHRRPKCPALRRNAGLGCEQTE